MDELDLGQTIRGFAAGQRLFDRYVLKEILGRGGMGVVWRAFDEQLDRDVALKFLPELLVLDKAAMDELKRETKRSLELTHHHIVRIYDFAHDNRSACISMEYIDGQTLSALRVEEENKIFEVDELAPLIEQACDALEYAHVKAKIVHRDLKPSNLMLNSQGELKVTDFGIARSLSDSASMLSVRTSGTLVYMSPQQLDGERANPADDIYSLGATIYELLTSKPPFYSGGIERQIHEKTPPSIAARRSELRITSDKIIPAEWEQTVAACLAKDPALRPQSAREAAHRLALTVPNYGKPTAVTPAVARVDTTKRKPASRKLVIAAALILLIVGGALGWYFGVYAPKEAAKKAEAIRVARQRAEEEAKAKAAEHAANARGAVLINTEPQGATVTLGDETQKSPATFNKVKVGNLLLKITLNGYDSVEQMLEIKEGEIANPGVIKLNRSAAALAVEAKKKEEVAAQKEPSLATKEHPWENSLGMKFVPVPGTNVLFSIWDTRVKDYRLFAEETGRDWPKPAFEQTDEHPAVNVSWDDAAAFCKWLTDKERRAGNIGQDQEYRLPTDLEWSAAVGLNSESGSTPKERDQKVKGLYPWGTEWPPPRGAGNYSTGLRVDDYDYTSPVGSFAANRYGLYDMGGNVFQWCEDWYSNVKSERVLRGGSWNDYAPQSALSSCRRSYTPAGRRDFWGFRVVVARSSSAPLSVTGSQSRTANPSPMPSAVASPAKSKEEIAKLEKAPRSILAGKWTNTHKSQNNGYSMVEVRTFNFDDAGKRGTFFETDTSTPIKSGKSESLVRKFTADAVIIEFDGRRGRYRETNCKLVDWPKKYTYKEMIEPAEVREFLAGTIVPFEVGNDTLTTLKHNRRYQRIR